ncbi:RHS repeat domain-containing protein [Escherichia albertii]|uniref:RHS repeat domain-containing protein n=1 Tax=Escherichia albertii TaxID=208962 RepID=UPI001300153B|nr:RHS repeat-associated core domain-containing protein [Escherichia albertii]
MERELPGGEIQKLEYDTFHRLVKVTCTPADWNMLIRYVNYDYDALNRRVRKWVKYERHAGSFSGRERETETWFLWEGMRLLGEEENGRPVVYVYEGPGSYVPLARIDGGREKATIRWYHCGVNGAPDRVTNEEGKTEWRHDTGGWGRTESEYEYGMIRENLRYQGQYLDRETGLHYNLHRYFAPECGRFIQPDPIGLLGGINLYQYAPNPLGWIDPLGLRKCSSSRKPVKTKSKSTGRTRPRNKNEEFALDHVMKHPENGMVIIKADQIGDPHFKGKGWSKVEQKINGVIVHYMAKFDKNGRMTHVTDYKIKD